MGQFNLKRFAFSKASIRPKGGCVWDENPLTFPKGKQIQVAEEPQKGGKMMRKTIVIGIMSLIMAGTAFADAPKVSLHGLWYVYSFFWSNADFDTATKDGDQSYYMHADVTGDADFGAGITGHVTVGEWGTFGRDPISYSGIEGQGEGAEVMEAYLNIANFFDTPFYLRVGKQHLLYGYQIFDGGEDGYTGVKLGYQSDAFNLDLMAFRVIEGGGVGVMGTLKEVPDDRDLYGAWGNFKFMDGAINFDPHFFWSTQDKDNPMWAGLWSNGSPFEGFDYSLNFTTMMGKHEDSDTFNYKGNHYMVSLDYAIPNSPISFGGAYVVFSGQDTSSTDYTLYFSPTGGPYTFGFYKDWPGFGPAHTLRTAYGFATVGPWEPMMTNLNVINAHLGFVPGPVNIRFDFFKYARNQAEPGNTETDMGNEIDLLLKYNYKDKLTFGFTAGMWMPGKYFGENLTNMLGGALWTAFSF